MNEESTGPSVRSMIPQKVPPQWFGGSASAWSLFCAFSAGVEMLALLSARQREVFDLVVVGRDTAAIAVALGIAQKTVQTHRHEIHRRLGTSGSSDLVRFAAATNVLGPILDAERARLQELLVSGSPKAANSRQPTLPFEGSDT